MKSQLSRLRRPAAFLCVLVVAGSAPAAWADTTTLEATADVVICSRLVDLAEFRSRAEAGNKDGLAVYLEGHPPACLVVAKGERVDQLDHTGNEVQVVTDHGTPRFIGWGARTAFSDRP